MVQRENLGNTSADDQQEQAPVPLFNDLGPPVTQSTNTVPFFRLPFYQPTFDAPGQGAGNPPPNQQQPLKQNPNEPSYQPTCDYPDEGIDGNFPLFQQQQQQQQPLNPHRPLSTTNFPARPRRTRTPAVDPPQIMMSGVWPTRDVNINHEMEFADPWQTPADETHKTRRRSRSISPRTAIPCA
jgi:hypothetical protein